MKRPVVLGTNPFIADIHSKTAAELFSATGGNSGNLAFLAATVSHLAGPVTILPWGAPRHAVRAAGDIIILPLANQLGHHTDLHDAARWLLSFDLPVVAVGLGAQADSLAADIRLRPGTAAWLNTLVKLSPSANPNIGVRGVFTQRVIERLGYENAATVIGCPSNFIAMEDPSARLAEGFNKVPDYIAVTAGIPFIPALAAIEQDLAEIVTLSGGAYIVQHGLEMLRLARREFALMPERERLLCRDYIRPALTLPQFEAWCVRHATAFYNAEAWMDYVKRFDFVVGTRFHGAMLALQAGVPAACITHDSRTKEMCDIMGVPHRSFSEIGKLTRETLLEQFSFDPADYADRRRTLVTRYIRLFADADIAITDGLRSLAAQPAPASASRTGALT